MATVTGTKRLLDISGDNITTAVSLEAEGTLLDSNGTSGTSGQLLSSTGTGVDWVSNNSGSWDGIFSGSAQITGSLGVTGSVLVDGNVGIAETSPGSKLQIGLETGTGSDGIFIKGEFAGGTAVVASKNPFISLGTSTSAGYTSTIYLGASATATDQDSKIEFNKSNNALSIYHKGQGTYREHVRFGDPGNAAPKSIFFGNVGIGVTSPSAALDVSVAYKAARFVSTQNTGLEVQGGGNSQNIAIFKNAGGYAEVVIDTAGKVGIGVTSPSAELDVSTAGKAARFVSSQSTGLEVQGGANSQDLAIFKNPGGITELVIKSTGNVGIGNNFNSPSERLEVSGGNLKVSNTGSPTLTLNSTNSTGAQIFALRNGSTSPPMGSLSWSSSSGISLAWYSTTYSQNSLVLDGSNFIVTNNGSERMRIISSGNVGIGTTNPGAKLEVIGGGLGAKFVSTQNTGLEVQGGANAQDIARFKNTVGNVQFVINNGGNIGIGTTSPTEKLQVTGNISASGDFIGTNFTGSSFTGSFVGDGSGLTDTPININAGTALTFSGNTLNVSTAGTNLGSANIPSTAINRNYVIENQNNAAQTLVVNVPWTDNNTTYTAGTGLSLSVGNVFSANTAGAVIGFMQIPSTVSNRYYSIQTNSSDELIVNIPWTDTSWDGIFSGSAQITGSLGVTGSLEVDGEITGSSLRLGDNATNNVSISSNSTSTTFATIGSGFVSPNLNFNIGGDTLLMVDGALGNVGIGTTSPNSKLEVIGSGIKTGADAFNTVNISSNLTGTTYSTNVGIGIGATPNIHFKAGPASRLFIKGSDGNVGIGNTNPTEKLQVTGNISASGDFIGNTLIATDLEDGVVPYYRNDTHGLQDQEMFSDNTNIYIGPNSPPNYYSRLTVEGTGISTTDIEVSGSLTYQEPTAASEFNGEIVTFGTFLETPAAGDLMCFNNTGFATIGWREANNSTSLDSTGMLGIAIGTTPTSGILLRGFARSALYNTTNLGTTPAGKKVYINSTNGLLTTTLPTSGYARIVGYVVEADATDGTIYFCPDNTFVEID